MSHFQTGRFSESDQSLVILFSWTKSIRELRGSKVVSIVGAGRVVQILDERIEALFVPRGQTNAQPQFVRRRQTIYGRETGKKIRHATGQNLQIRAKKRTNSTNQNHCHPKETHG